MSGSVNKAPIFDYPSWICGDCGDLLGRRKCNEYATWHLGTCGVCKKETMVTEPRDFGHLTSGWEKLWEDANKGT